MRYLIVFCIIFSLLSDSFGQAFIPLWPEGKIPNSKGLELTHEENNQRITRVAEPGIYTFFTSKEENSGSAVLICPSGGYHHLTYNLGGFQLAKWFNSIGINAFVLIYRLPTESDLEEREKGPIQDAQRAMKIIRANADKWLLDPSAIGSMGTSAGGHLASTLGTHSTDYSSIGDSLDLVEFRPDFMILVSAVISMGDHGHKGSIYNLLGENPSEEHLQMYSNELHVSENTPEAFLVHAQNDPVVDCRNSLLFYQAMIDKGVKGSLHIFPDGKHKINLRGNPGTTNLWTDICEEWLKEMKIIQP
ncbi:MAG: alpha/beta hydrolase [Bacteroidetes bacterium]|nr:MAG: alpha/beta hydrolase [Bacteroidota bacterium]